MNVVVWDVDESCEKKMVTKNELDDGTRVVGDDERYLCLEE